MKTIDEILDEWDATIPDEEHSGLYARDKVKLIAREFSEQFSQNNDVCCDFLEWVNLHTHFYKSPNMKHWYDKSKIYGEKGFTTMELYELFVAQHITNIDINKTN